MNDPENEDDLGLKDKVDYYILSVNFFKFYYDTFGCDNLIVQRHTKVAK